MDFLKIRFHYDKKVAEFLIVIANNIEKHGQQNIRRNFE
jgi:hypothetical protein